MYHSLEPRGHFALLTRWLLNSLLWCGGRWRAQPGRTGQQSLSPAGERRRRPLGPGGPREGGQGVDGAGKGSGPAEPGAPAPPDPAPAPAAGKGATGRERAGQNLVTKYGKTCLKSLLIEESEERE